MPTSDSSEVPKHRLSYKFDDADISVEVVESPQYLVANAVAKAILMIGATTAIGIFVTLAGPEILELISLSCK